MAKMSGLNWSLALYEEDLRDQAAYLTTEAQRELPAAWGLKEFAAFTACRGCDVAAYHLLDAPSGGLIPRECLLCETKWTELLP